jgi:hypothetical protein
VVNMLNLPRLMRLMSPLFPTTQYGCADKPDSIGFTTLDGAVSPTEDSQSEQS